MNPTMEPSFGAAQHAIIIGIDGITPYTLEDSIARGIAPNLQALRSRGSRANDVRVTQPSSSLSSWASILTGAPPVFHGHGAAGAPPVRPATYPEHIQWPTIFAAVREANPAMTTGAYYSWPPLGGLIGEDRLNSSVLTSCEGCEQCIEAEPAQASEYVKALKRRRFSLSWVYFDVLDECAHWWGNSDDRYFSLVTTVDDWVGQILRALRVAKMEQSTLVFVLSDHGRRTPGGRDHGAFTTDEMVVPWIIAGPGVRADTQLTWPISSTDAAPTVLHALGIRAPLQMHGRVVHEIFEEGGASAWWVGADKPDRRLHVVGPRQLRGAGAGHHMLLHRSAAGGLALALGLGAMLVMLVLSVTRRSRGRTTYACLAPAAAAPA